MGNRAVITASKSKTSGVGIYLHWNGGLESVLAFLEVCNQRDYRTPGTDESYAMARLTGVLHEFFDGGLSLGLGTLKSLDTSNGDNGTYVIGPGWEVASRWGAGCQKDRLTAEHLTSEERERMRQIVAHITKHRATPPGQ